MRNPVAESMSASVEREIAFRMAAPRRRQLLTVLSALLACAAMLSFASLAINPGAISGPLFATGCALLVIGGVLAALDRGFARQGRRNRRDRAIADYARFEADFDAHLRPRLAA